MTARDPRIDGYIAKSAEFARPILKHLRAVVHAGCPAVEETIKWGMPHFMYRGMLCHMAAFKHHVAFGFWKGKILVRRGDDRSAEAMGNFGKISRLADLPPKRTIVGYVKQAMALNAVGVVRPPKKKAAPKPPVKVPADLAAALKKNSRARAAFEEFTPSHRREYIEWITEAKREETRARRLATTLEWLAAGKSRNWKYEKC